MSSKFGFEWTQKDWIHVCLETLKRRKMKWRWRLRQMDVRLIFMQRLERI